MKSGIGKLDFKGLTPIPVTPIPAGSHLIAEVASGDISRRRHYEAHRKELGSALKELGSALEN